MKTITFTSTLSSDLMDWVKIYSSKKNLTHRAVLKSALEEFKRQSKQKALEESFKRATQDIEIKKMAEEGFDDYEAQLKITSVVFPSRKIKLMV